MKDANIEQLLIILKESLNQIKFDEDIHKITHLYNALEKIKKELPTFEELEELQKIETDLEIKYEEFYELGNYFDPVYVKIKNKIHEEGVKKIREANKRKRANK